MLMSLAIPSDMIRISIPTNYIGVYKSTPLGKKTFVSSVHI